MAAALAAGWWFERAWVALLAIWWMKPAYDRVVLHVLSRAVFGELPTTRAVFGAAKEWLRTGLLTALLLRLWPDIVALVHAPGAPARRPVGPRRPRAPRRARTPHRQLCDLAHAHVPGDRDPGPYRVVRPDHRAFSPGEGKRRRWPARAHVRQQRGHRHRIRLRRCLRLRRGGARARAVLRRRRLRPLPQPPHAAGRLGHRGCATEHRRAACGGTGFRSRHRRGADALSELCPGKRPEAGNRQGAGRQRSSATTAT